MQNSIIMIRRIIYLTLYSLILALFQPALASVVTSEYISVSGSNCLDGSDSQQGGHNSVHLDCKTYIQTTSYSCGPAAVMTLLRYYNRLSDKEMNPKTELRIAMEMNATGSGTSLDDMSSWLEAHNFKVDSGRFVRSSMIVDNLKKNIPTIISMNNHWILSKGYSVDDASKEVSIEFSDSCCQTAIMAAADIDSLWQESQMANGHCGKNVGEYIVATPK